MCCFVILLLSNEMQMSVRRFSAIPHLRDFVFLNLKNTLCFFLRVRATEPLRE